MTLGGFCVAHEGVDDGERAGNAVPTHTLAVAALAPVAEATGPEVDF